jgi:hypothetical protein
MNNINILIVGAENDGEIITDLSTRIRDEYVQVQSIHDEQAGQGKMGHDYYQQVERLIREADLIIADLNIESIGVGFIIGQAVEAGKLVACLYRAIPLDTQLKKFDKVNLHFFKYSDIDDATKWIRELIGD